MAEPTPTLQAYFTSSYVFGNGTTSTVALKVWQALSEQLAMHQRPATGEGLCQQTGLTPEQIEDLFSHQYYQKHYGFRRFDTLAHWEAWAKEQGILFIPGVHDVPEIAVESESPAPDAAEPAEG